MSIYYTRITAVTAIITFNYHNTIQYSNCDTFPPAHTCAKTRVSNCFLSSKNYAYARHDDRGGTGEYAVQ